MDAKMVKVRIFGFYSLSKKKEITRTILIN